MQYIDTHCHLQDIQNMPLNQIVHNCIQNNVKAAISCPAKPSDFAQIDDLMGSENFQIVKAYGVHPYYADDFSENVLNILEEKMTFSNKNIIGEIGLDYKTSASIEIQEKVFIEQFKLADKYKRPVIIHNRGKYYEMKKILLNQKFDIPFTIHSYSGPEELIKKFADKNAYFGISGIIAFGGIDSLNRIKEFPVDRILFETDSPYLKFNKHEDNFPFYISEIANQVAKIRGMDVSVLSEIVFNNTIELYKNYITT